MKPAWQEAIDKADAALADLFVYRLGLNDPDWLHPDDVLRIELPARATYEIDGFAPTVTEFRPIAVYVLYG